MLPLLLNTLSVISAKITIPRTGVWLADLDVDLDITGILPIGKCTLTVGSTVMIGTIDPRASGTFGQSGHVQVVGGGGGWDTAVLGLHIHNDAGILNSQVYAQTAAEVGEVVVTATPKLLGVDYVRTAGPASRVLDGVDWYVDTTGITNVAPRLPIPLNPLTVDILSWDPVTKCAELASDELVLPGTVLVDIRFGTATVRDVEQSFSADGSSVKAFCDVSTLAVPLPQLPAEAPGTRVARALASIAREACGVPYLKLWHYRIVLQDTATGRLTLQLVDIIGQAPLALTEIPVWPGIASMTHKFVPGTEVLVAFSEGSPIVVGFAPTAPPPLVTQIDAVRIALGTIAAAPVAKAPGTQAQIAALTTAVGAIAAWIAAVTALAATPPTSTTFTLFGAAMAGPGATVATALGGLSAAVAAQVTLATSPKTFTD